MKCPFCNKEMPHNKDSESEIEICVINPNAVINVLPADDPRVKDNPDSFSDDVNPDDRPFSD